MLQELRALFSFLLSERSPFATVIETIGVVLGKEQLPHYCEQQQQQQLWEKLVRLSNKNDEKTPD
jgi:hypothetical protein